jgi:hypothetical protein
MVLSEFENISDDLWRLYFDGYREKEFKIHFMLVMKVISRIYVSNELQNNSTRMAVPVCRRRHSAPTLPP